MRKLWIIVFLLIGQQLLAQGSNPVQWQFSVKKLSEGVYEWKAKAAINKPWHIYSQSSPDGGPIPTSISFNKNPLIQPEGKNVKELGKMITKREEVFEKVFKLKKKAKTNISGTIEFMVCNESECLPPSSQSFSIALE